MVYRPFRAVLIVLPILVADGIVELALLSSMVAFLNGRASYAFSVTPPDGRAFLLKGHPAGLQADQGHTSNGAAGTAVVLIGFGGLLALLSQRRQMKMSSSSRPTAFFTFWTVCTILSALLTLAALIYTFILTNNTDNQTINLPLAAANASPRKYPADDWTPETWFVAVYNQVPLTSDGDRAQIEDEIRLMKAWRWNLIPLLVFGVATAGAAVYEWLSLRRGEVRYAPAATKDRVGHSI